MRKNYLIALFVFFLCRNALKRCFLFAILAFLFTFNGFSQKDSIYVYQNGSILFKEAVNKFDSITFVENISKNALHILFQNEIIFNRNVSEIDRTLGLVAIKPSGVPYEDMKVDDIVIVNLNGEIIEGNLRPSSDLLTHIELYKKYPQITAIVHTHSKWATIFSQAVIGIPTMGTTHADYFYGDIPCTRQLTDNELKYDYEKNTGKVIIETIKDNNPLDVPAILVASHAPFTFGDSAAKAVENALVLEEVANMAWHTLVLKNGTIPTIQKDLLDVHYFRKHGKNAYYGQKK